MFDRPDRKMKGCSDLGVGDAIGQECCDLLFTSGQSLWMAGGRRRRTAGDGIHPREAKATRRALPRSTCPQPGVDLHRRRPVVDP
jgi:hypothetical protein